MQLTILTCETDRVRYGVVSQGDLIVWSRVCDQRTLYRQKKKQQYPVTLVNFDTALRTKDTTMDWTLLAAAFAVAVARSWLSPLVAN